MVRVERARVQKASRQIVVAIRLAHGGKPAVGTGAAVVAGFMTG
jgi:hypothetical protein